MMRRTHRVEVRRGGRADPYTGAVAWTFVAACDANLQPLTGSVQQTAAGREVGATWKAFVPGHVPVRADDGIRVVSGVGPERFRVVQVGEQGGGWDTELLLATTREEIGE